MVWFSNYSNEQLRNWSNSQTSLDFFASVHIEKTTNEDSEIRAVAVCFGFQYQIPLPQPLTPKQASGS